MTSTGRRANHRRDALLSARVSSSRPFYIGNDYRSRRPATRRFHPADCVHLSLPFRGSTGCVIVFESFCSPVIDARRFNKCRGRGKDAAREHEKFRWRSVKRRVTNRRFSITSVKTGVGPGLDRSGVSAAFPLGGVTHLEALRPGQTFARLVVEKRTTQTSAPHSPRCFFFCSSRCRGCRRRATRPRTAPCPPRWTTVKSRRGPTSRRTRPAVATARSSAPVSLPRVIESPTWPSRSIRPGPVLCFSLSSDCLAFPCHSSMFQQFSTASAVQESGSTS